MKQRERVFFGEKDPWGAAPPTDAEREQRVSRDNPGSPFARFVGNDKAVRKMQVAAYAALGRYNHLSRDLAFAIYGPASAGKTTLGRLYAETLELPFLEVSPKSAKSLDDLYRLTARKLSDEGLPLVEVVRRNHYVLPPVVIFLDEVHALSDSVVQGLLKATEFSDALMVTESGRSVNTFNVQWMMATTDEGKLFDAFRTRFSPVQLTYLGQHDIARIVKLSNPDLDDEVCLLVAHYNSRVPRKALEFARYMKMVRAMTPGKAWAEVAREVATDEGIDEHGMQEIHVRILRALGQGPVAQKRMPLIVGRKDDEVERYVMPWLLTETDDQQALVTVSGKGYTITSAGLAELERRGIQHGGSKVLAAA